MYSSSFCHNFTVTWQNGPVTKSDNYSLCCTYITVVRKIIIVLPESPVVVSVRTADFNVTEGSSGESTIVTSCLITNLTRGRAVNHTFEVTVSPSSTADFGGDYYFNTSSRFLTIPAGISNRMITTCVNVSIIGDNFAEHTEFIIITIVPLLANDGVVYPPGFSFINITIFDNDPGSL